MADTKKTESSTELNVTTTYVVDKAPSLPNADVTSTRPDPVIDQRLIEARNAEAKANADRVSK